MIYFIKFHKISDIIVAVFWSSFPSKIGPSNNTFEAIGKVDKVKPQVSGN